MVRVLIADDHPVFRFGLRTLLKADPAMEVVGEAVNGEEAIAQASSRHPDVILMDLNMPGMNGIEAIRRILADHPQVHILALTMFDDDDSVFAAMRAGACGYLLKGAEGRETLQAIHVVSTGEAIFSPAIAQRLMQYFGGPPPPSPSQPFPDLTERESYLFVRITPIGLMPSRRGSTCHCRPKSRQASTMWRSAESGTGPRRKHTPCQRRPGARSWRDAHATRTCEPN